MASDSDEIHERLIEYFSPRIQEKIDVTQVLDYLHFIPVDRMEKIRQKERTEGNIAAVRLLISTVVEKPHTEGWFTAFVDALLHGGSELAAQYLVDPPEPEVEAENDCCVKLIRLLAPSLIGMKTGEVVVECYSQKLLTDDDRDRVLAEMQNHGPIRGASELLIRIVRRPPGWFSTFLLVLQKTEHKTLFRELNGGPPECDQQGHAAAAVGPKSMRNDVMEQHAAAAEKSPAAESCESPESMEINVTKQPEEDATGLYASAEPSERMENLRLDPGAAAAATRSPEQTEIHLRDYQMEVARPALEGKNIIICLPTGSGKTRAAVYVTKKHLDSRREEGKPGKVVVLVNKVPLVDQHYTTEFLPVLKQTYKVERVSGDSQLKISFAKIVQSNDIIICTAQILENFLERADCGDDEGVKLSDLTLIIIDECHHTQKGEVYNHIMMQYLKQKHKNVRLKKEQKETVPLPQILGLTASPGVGGANTVGKAVEHIMRICANLDASKIMTRSQEENRKQLRKTILTVENREEDPFGDVIKTIMNAIHDEGKLSPTCDLGTQNYEQWAVQKERQAAKEEDQTERVCAEYLRKYNEGLILSNTIRMCDALQYLNKFHEEQFKKKASVDDEQNIQITDTERFLFNLFKDKKEELEKLSNDPKYENDSLSKLRKQILKEFTSRDQARGIIFTKTRHSAITLSQWIQENSKFADVEVRPSHVIGGGDQSDTKPMTAAEQKNVLKKFRTGEVNLLVATTVAEEGLDIPACNFVIRYGLSTNEIAMIQAQGRGRAEDSSYTVVDVKNSGVAERECVNEYREDMMTKAIKKIKDLNEDVYNKQITEFQLQAVMEAKMRRVKQKQKVIKEEKPSDVKFSCRNCTKHVCSGDDIHIIENMHRVNVTPQFKELFIERENATLQERLVDYEINSTISCKDCGQPWGTVMMYRGLKFPCLNVKNFVVNIRQMNKSNCTKWSDLPIKFTDFDYVGHASMMALESDDEETE